MEKYFSECKLLSSKVKNGDHYFTFLYGNDKIAKVKLKKNEEFLVIKGINNENRTNKIQF